MKSVFKVKAIAVLTAMLFICVFTFTACPNTVNKPDTSSAGNPSNPPVVPPKPPVTPPSADDITITVIGDEHVQIKQSSFTVPKDSVWLVVVVKAIDCVDYETGWELKCWKRGGKTGPVINWGGEKTFNASATIYAQVQQTAAKVEGGVSFLLDPSQLQLKIKAVTEDNSAVTIEGCTETSIPSGQEKILTATSTQVVLKGKITELYCDRNKITSLNVQGLNALKLLDCSGNQLTSLDVQGLTALEKLDCYYNYLTSLNVQGLNRLQKLNCASCLLTSLNVQGLINLQYLDCNDNQLSSLNVQGLPVLKMLECYGSGYGIQLTSLNLQNLPALEWLRCDRHRLTSLDVQDLTALQVLSCTENLLVSLDVRHLTVLRELYCSFNKLTVLNVQGLANLETLKCYRNDLISLNMQGLASLRGLDCCYNQLTSLDTHGLPYLSSVICYNNRLTSLDVRDLPALTSLYCWGNKLDAQAFVKIFNDLPVKTGNNYPFQFCGLYSEDPQDQESNHTDFNDPLELKEAFERAKTHKNWVMKKAKHRPDGVYEYTEI